jgi:hypothetical protein
VALTVGAASTALAGNNSAPALKLGIQNTANAVTKLVGSVAGPSVQVDNNSADAAATALELQVEPGKAPMKVNSDTQVANLNADKVDNLDSSAFVRKAYTKWKTSSGTVNQDYVYDYVFCDSGDFAITGGYDDRDVGTEIIKSGPYVEALSGTVPYGWHVKWKNDGTTDTITLSTVCADLGTPHQL